MTATTPARYVPLETAGIVEAMLVTADNHSDVAAWVRSKGGGWHTHGKSWGNPGLGISPDGSGDRTRSVDDGEVLVWGDGHFFRYQADLFDQRYVPESSLLPDVTDDTQLRAWLLRLRADRSATEALATITEQIQNLIRLRYLACWAALANQEPDERIEAAGSTVELLDARALGDWRTRQLLARLGVDDENASADCRPRWNPALDQPDA